MVAFFCHFRTANAFVKTLQRNIKVGSTAATYYAWLPISIDDAVVHRRKLGYHISGSSGHSTAFTSPTTKLFSSVDATDTSTSIDPYSEEAKQNLAKLYSSLDPELSSFIDTDVEKAHKSLLKLTEQVLAWNQRLNLVSRKDCTASVVYHRHVLPSVALLPLIVSELKDGEISSLNIVDVGTGGGFPG